MIDYVTTRPPRRGLWYTDDNPDDLDAYNQERTYMYTMWDNGTDRVRPKNNGGKGFGMWANCLIEDKSTETMYSCDCWTPNPKIAKEFLTEHCMCCRFWNKNRRDSHGETK